MGPNQTYKLLHSKGNHKKTPKGQPIDWQKIFANAATKKGLIFKIYKQVDIKKQATQSKYGQKI